MFLSYGILPTFVTNWDSWMRLLLIILLIGIAPVIPPALAQEVRTGVQQLSTKPDVPESVEISAYDSVIVVSNAPKGSRLEIYSVVGIKVREIEMKETSGEYPVNIAKGYYIVRIGETVRKIAIR